MIRAWWVVALVATGCEVPMPTNELADPPPYESRAIEMAVETWSDVLGVPLVEPPPFVWFEGECLDYQDGEPPCEWGRSHLYAYYRQEEIHGIRDHHVHVIAHESLHWALGLWGDLDPDHSRSEWGMVSGLETDMASLGF